MEAIKEYDAKVDGKNRVTLRGAQYEYYNVKEYDNGCYVLEPRELTAPEEISHAHSTIWMRRWAISRLERHQLLWTSQIFRGAAWVERSSA